MSRSRAVAAVTLLLCGLSLAPSAQADPYRPTRDNEILEVLPRGTEPGSDAALRALRELHARDPSNPDIALRLAQRQIDAARAASDPRLWGQAQATLSAWWDQASPPPELRRLRAAIRQNRHEFAAANADLQAVVAQQPGQAQGWLDLASLQLATGELADAARSCDRVVAAGAVGEVCRAAVDALSGRAAEAYAALEQIVTQQRLHEQPRGVQTWALTVLAETAERLGHADAAERWYRGSLLIDPADSYTLAAYADFLLDRRRAAEVVALIAADTTIDALLLRRVEADNALGAAGTASGIATLAARFEASRKRGDSVHRREESRFHLVLAPQPDAALELALLNWAQQKEPLDARIALQAALAAGQPAAAAEVARWVHDSGLQDVRLTPLLQRLRTP